MPRLVGVEIPKNKKVIYSLPYVFGIGKAVAAKLCEAANIDPNLRADKLTDADLHKISELIGKFGIKVEGDAKREIAQNIKRLISINSYRGTRHKKGLPVHGQNTHANARTRKGPRKG